MKVLIIILAIIIIFLIISYGVYYCDYKKRLRNRMPIKNLNIESITIDGVFFSNKELLKNDITVVCVWGTYCNICKKQLQEIEYIYEKYADKKLGALGIVIDLPRNKPNKKTLKKVESIVTEYEISYPNVYIDDNMKAYLSDKVFLVPTVVIVDKFGKVIGDMTEGAHTRKELEKSIYQIFNLYDLKNV